MIFDELYIHIKTVRFQGNNPIEKLLLNFNLKILKIT